MLLWSQALFFLMDSQWHTQFISFDFLGTDRHLCRLLHWLSKSAVFTCLPEFEVPGCTGLLFESFIQNLHRLRLWHQHWDQFGWTLENTDPFRLVSTLLAESLRSFDLCRNIEGDSVRRVSDQIFGSYLLSYMVVSVYEVARVTCHCCG